MALQTVDFELIKKAQTGDQEALALAMERHTPLVMMLVNKYQVKTFDREDIVSVANIGLLKAIKQFDFTHEVQFSTYAVPLILGEIKRFFREDGAIKVSRQYKELYNKIVKAEKALAETLQRPITLEDVEHYLGVSYEELIIAYDAHFYPTSLSSPLDTENLTLEDTLGVYETTELMDKVDLYDAIERLDPKEKLFVQLRFFEGKKQEELALRFCCSQVQMSRLEKKIIAKLKTMLV